MAEILLRGSALNLEKIYAQNDPAERKTKVICTLGPACWTVDKLAELIECGMGVARFNFSHGDHEGHGACLDRLREAMARNPEKQVAVLLDTKGPEIRTGLLEDHKPIEIIRDSLVEVTTDYEFLGNANKIACSYKSLPTTVKPGSTILVADGSLILTVVECKADSVITKAMNNAKIGEKKNMNLPGAIVDLPTLTEKDINDLVNFGVAQGVDFIAASFVRKAADVKKIREVLGEEGSQIKIISKIENQEGLDNFTEIMEESDGIMVARGDLGMELPPEKVFLAQKMMIRMCNVAGKPVVTATQMLESMITNPRPTRAECTDVANAVLDGTDCVMLSGETANGGYPEMAVTIMAKICREAESALTYDRLYQAVRNSTLKERGIFMATESVCSSAVKTAYEVNAKMIIVLSESGNSARYVCKYRPQMPVLVFTANAQTARQVSGYCRGATVRVMGSMIGTEAILFRGIDYGQQYGWLKAGDKVVCVHGTTEAVSGSTNMLRVLQA